MLNDWFQSVEFECAWETFQALPRHPAYRYEYRKQQAIISGNPQFYHAVFNFDQLSERTANTRMLRSLAEGDHVELARLFVNSFENVAPIAQLTESQRITCAHELVRQALSGSDGPLVESASLVSMTTAGELNGAILITLLPSDDVKNFHQVDWEVQPPLDAANTGWGVPHLTWICVDPQHSRSGIGTQLLLQSAVVLEQLGYQKLISTFLLGNQVATLWHWKAGFDLLPRPGSSS